MACKMYGNRDLIQSSIIVFPMDANKFYKMLKNLYSQVYHFITHLTGSLFQILEERDAIETPNYCFLKKYLFEEGNIA